MTLTLAEPLWLLAGSMVALAMAGLFILAERRAWSRLGRFAESALVARLTESHSRRRLWIKNGLLLAIVWLLCISLARPQWGANWEKAETRGIDVMIALDTSRSMLAEDISPNRLERSKLAILDLLETLKGDRVGLIAFAGNAFLQCPLTLDYQAFRQTLAAVNTETIPIGGTDVASAIDEAEAYFEKTGNERILILITDGEDLEASGVRRAGEVSAKGTRILAVGVGSPSGELIPVTTAAGEQDFLRDSSGKPVSTALDEATLKRIAAASNGLYAPLGPTGGGLQRVYEFSLAQSPASKRQETLQRIPIERYQWPLCAALVLLIIETILTTRRRNRHSPGAARALGLILVAGSVLALPGKGEAGPASEASKAYKEGRFEESMTLYQQALEEKPDDPKLRFNLGVSAYRSGQYEEAIANFGKALKPASPSFQAKTFYNSGNSRVAYGFAQLEDQPTLTRDQWIAARTDYENALAVEPDYESASGNLARLEETIASYTHTLTTTANPTEGGTVSPGGPSFHKIPFEITAKAADGWLFTEWIGEGIEDPTKANTTVRLEEDLSVTATFVKTWNLEVLTEDPGMGSAEKSGTYRADEPVSIKAEALDYFAFSRWRPEGCELADASAAETDVTLDGDAKVTALFVPAFKLSVLPDPEIGGQAGQSGFFEEYSVVPLQAQPRDGFEWVGWIGDGIDDPTQQQTTIALTGDRVAIAKMNRIWNLVIIPTPEEGGTVTGAGNHSVGSTVDISATPAEGFTFQGWEGPGVEDPAASETRVTVESTEHTLFAVFQQDDQENDQQDQDQEQDQEQQSSGENQDQQDSQNEQNEQNENQEEQAPQEEQDSEEQSDGEEQEQEQGEEQGEESPQDADPAQQLPMGEMTREEARQLLNALSESEKFLPASERSQEKDARQPSGRNW